MRFCKARDCADRIVNRPPTAVYCSTRCGYRERSKLRYEADPARQRAKSRRWIANNPAKWRAVLRRYSAAHPGRGRASWWANHDRELERQRAYYARNPFPNIESRSRRRLRSAAQICEHLSCHALGPTLIAWQTNAHVCWMCGTAVSMGAKRGEPGFLHMDHVVPLALGGLHCAANLRPACASCNQRKGARPPMEVAA